MTQLNYKKIFALGVIAVIFAIIGWALPITTTNESVFQIEVNNTNLAPTVPGETNGTGERVQGVTYYANQTPIELFLWGHGQNISQTAELHLFINGTKVADTSGRALGAAEQSNKTIVAMIPRYASYKVEVHDIHHYEWREYKVLSGQNGSVIINYINTSSINQSALDLKVNKSGDTWSGNMIMDGTTITTNTVGDKDAYIYEDSILPTVRLRARNVSTYGYFELFPYYADILVSGRRFNFTNASLDMGNASLINCSNCVNQTSLNGKVNTSGDTLTGKLNNTYIDIENIINITLGQLEIKSTNLTTLNTGDLVIIPEQIDIEVHNGSTNRLSLTNDTTLINIDGSDEYTFNKSSLDLKNNNITNCANCQVTGHGLARAYLNGSQLNISSGSLTHVNLNSVSYNPYGEFNITSGNYTVPVDGYYDILSSITYSDVLSPADYITEIRANGTIIMFVEVHSSLNTFLSSPAADTWYLKNGTEIGLYGIQNTGFNTVDIAGTGPGVTWMSISLKSKVPP